MNFKPMIKHFFLLFLSILGAVVGSNAQDYNFTSSVNENKITSIENIKFFIDCSKSMQGFFKGYSTAEKDKFTLYRLFDNSTLFNAEFYAFGDTCVSRPINGSITTAMLNASIDGSFFNGKQNVYSSAIRTLPKGDNHVSVMLTDGVPSIITKGDPDIARNDERLTINSLIRNYLAIGDNSVLMYRVLANYDGRYYLSDESRSIPFVGRRNAYLLFFCNDRYINEVDKIMKSLPTDLEIQRLDYVKNFLLEDFQELKLDIKGQDINFEFKLSFKESIPSSSFLNMLVGNKPLKDVTCTNLTDKELFFQGSLTQDQAIKDINNCLINFKPANNYNDFLKFNVDDEVESNLINRPDFHTKTFRLRYLLDGINENLKDSNSMSIHLNLCKNGKSWLKYFEPIFGLLPVNYTNSELQRDNVPLQLFLFRWMPPILICLVLFMFLFDFKLGKVSNVRTQKTLWVIGLILVIIISLIASLRLVYASQYSIESTGYKLKHLIYNPLFSVFLYFILTLILRKRSTCLARSIPF